ncbi:MAG: polysaccharide deacetylase family protein [Undibacterium sp.]|nr:polysaccharide deacetylase family protein [Undibacterium sp.]
MQVLVFVKEDFFVKYPRLLISVLFFSLTLLGQLAQAEVDLLSPAPLRFLLTFDDGPSAALEDNPTEKILTVLKNNPLQHDIKAIFFTQTRAKRGGGTEHGREVLKTVFDQGHLLALHSATPSHANHRYLSAEELEASLNLGINDLSQLTGVLPSLVRPPFWSYDERTFASYQQHNLQMLLTDLSANDGVIYGINFSLTKRRNMRKLLLALRPAWLAGELTSVDGATPIVVTFHDINSYTANHMEEYLQILVDVARELEMPTAPLVFYGDRVELEKAALSRTVKDASVKQNLPGVWNWIWN